LDLGGDGYDSAGYRGDFYVVGQLNTTFGLFFILVFANQDPFAYRFDYFERLCFGLFFFVHFCPVLSKNLVLNIIIIIHFLGCFAIVYVIIIEGQFIGEVYTDFNRV